MINMNLLCTSDPHGVVPVQMSNIIKEREIDAIICAGDFTPHGWHGEGGSMEDVINFLLSLNKPIFFVHGNIDPSPDYFSSLEANYKNLNYIHLKRAKIGDYYLVGIGDFHFMPNIVIDKLEELVKRDPKKTIIVSHYPPKGLVDFTSDGEHAGIERFREIIEKYQPLLFICGHIHEAAGVTKLGKTTIVNASMKNILAEINDGEVNISLV